MLRGVKAGIEYFVIVFVAGFLLGTLRVTIIVPQLGLLTAVLIELPIMFAISWVTCRWIIHRYTVPDTLTDRLAMGGIAFTLLMASELNLSVFIFKHTVIEYLASFQTTPAVLGLLMQICFALIPIIQRSPASRKP